MSQQHLGKVLQELNAPPYLQSSWRLECTLNGRPMVLPQKRRPFRLHDIMRAPPPSFLKRFSGVGVGP